MHKEHGGMSARRDTSPTCCTTFSDVESKADVASSRRSTLGFRISARAIAIRSKSHELAVHFSSLSKNKDVVLTFLTSRKLRAFSAYFGVESLRKRRDEIVYVCCVYIIWIRCPNSFGLGFCPLTFPASFFKLFLSDFLRGLRCTE